MRSLHRGEMVWVKIQADSDRLRGTIPTEDSKKSKRNCFLNLRRYSIVSGSRPRLPTRGHTHGTDETSRHSMNDAPSPNAVA